MTSAFRHISELESHGVSRADLSKLSDAGFCTVESVSIFEHGNFITLFVGWFTYFLLIVIRPTLDRFLYPT